MSIEKQIAELKETMASDLMHYQTRIEELEKQLTKKGQVVPWVGAHIVGKHTGIFYEADGSESNMFYLLDAPLHPWLG